MIQILILSFLILTQAIPTNFEPLWAIHFSEENPSQDFLLNFAETYNMDYKGTVGVLTHIHLFQFSKIEKRNLYLDFIDLLYEKNGAKRDLEMIQWFEPQIAKKREKRNLSVDFEVDSDGFVHSEKRSEVVSGKRSIDITDPLWPDQWHLHGDSVNVNAEAAWEKGFMGEGVVIAIVDDGIESKHPDLIANFKLDSSWNYNENKQSPDPTYRFGASGDWHGTSSAGTAAARNDGASCGVGVAPHASLAGVAILQNNADVPDATEAKALCHEPQLNDIYSNSWGPIRPGGSGHSNEGPEPLARAAMETCIETGRGGLGSVYVWAAGNDKGGKDNCNYDGYANLRYTILIGSTSKSGKETYYSEPCAALHAVTPGGLSNEGIQTTDLIGREGKSTTSDCTSFAGTSASCPMAAGVIALILQANPQLTWLDVQYVVAESVIKNDPSDEDWVQNAAGRWVNHKFGYGLLDAGKAVDAARRLVNSVEEISTSVENNEEAHAEQSDDGTYLCTSEILITEEMRLHHVEVKLTATHSDVGKTKILLFSPSGTESILGDYHSDTLSSWNGWVFSSNRYMDELSAGAWILKVIDSENGNGYIESWSLSVYGRDKDQVIFNYNGTLPPYVPITESSSSSSSSTTSSSSSSSIETTTSQSSSSTVSTSEQITTAPSTDDEVRIETVETSRDNIQPLSEDTILTIIIVILISGTILSVIAVAIFFIFRMTKSTQSF